MRQARRCIMWMVWFFIILLCFSVLPARAGSVCAEDFEGGLGEWSVDGGTWEVGVPTSGPGTVPSGVNCAATVLDGNYATTVSSRLISPPCVIPSASENPRLRFWNWYSCSYYDYGEVQIKVGDGTWETISPQYTWSSSGVWTRPSIDLSDYAGLTVQIAFYFYSSDHNVSAGWYIDDVAVITGPVVFNNPEDFEGGLGDWYVDAGTWEVGVPTSGPGSAYSGDNCAATVLDGNYATIVSSRLISPAFVVPSASENPRLRFWHWYSFSHYDYGEVQIKVGDGTWETISPQYTWSSSGVWTRPSIYELSDYAGLTVQIAFYFYSSDHNVSAGWYVDDVVILTDATLDLGAGWSMVSLPVHPMDKRLKSVFPGARVVYGYKKGTGYVRIGNDNDLEVGKGYWILLDQATRYTLTGDLIPSYTHQASSDGWAMIGGCTCPAQVLLHGCEIGVIYGYAQGTGYQRVTGHLERGKGYWILIKNAISEATISVETVD